MAKKNSMEKTVEEREAKGPAESKKGGKPSCVFGQVKVKAKITQYTYKSGGCEIGFEKLKLADGQAEQLRELVDNNKDEVELTISQIQGRLCD